MAIENYQKSETGTESNSCDPQFIGNAALSGNPDEFNLLEYIYVIVKNKWWIIGSAILGVMLGYGLAIKKGPTYVAESIIAAKESDNQTSAGLSGFGALGGIVASQLNMSTNPGLDKIQLIINSRKFNADFVQKYNLLPLIYKDKWPKVYKKYYDSIQCKWRSDFVQPKMLAIGALVKDNYLKREIKDKTLTLKVKSSDSTIIDTFLSRYLQFLNYHIQTTVQNDAKENVSYLENRLVTITDPLLREKVQSMIANEIEKSMLVSKVAFQIIDPEITYVDYSIKSLYPIISGALFFFIAILFLLCTHAFKSGINNCKNEMLVDKIKENLMITRKR